MTNELLLPCPFCGNNNISLRKYSYNHLTDWYIARCKECKAGIHHFKREETINNWNKRINNVTQR